MKNNKHRVTLPLQNRSKGFNWFFSFLVWFSKIQKKTNNTYILLLDEPGLNLHAAAQADLLRFIETELASKYQIIYTTHSPFMVENAKLNQVRTVYDAPDEKIGSIISDVVQEKDPDTLFPLQAALGYDIAQNLFITPKNILVEGVSDLMFLTAISEVLSINKKHYLADDICLVPVGGMDKVATFISLLRGQKLDIVCLLDVSKVGQQRLKDMVAQKIIQDKKILYFDKFAYGATDLEDMFSVEEYLHLFNLAFNGRYPTINKKDIDSTKPILGQINRLLKVERFNHYLPANEFLKIADKSTFLSDATKERFSFIFEEVNKLLK